MFIFLPVRRIPEKGDGILQEEIKLIHYHFGEEAFKCMVIVLTASPFDRKELEVTEELESCTKDIFEVAAKASTGVHIFSPPIVYISLKHTGDEIRKNITSAIGNSQYLRGLTLHVSNENCSKCSINYELARTNTKSLRIVKRNEKCHPCFAPAYSNFQKSAGQLLHYLSFGIAGLCGIPTLRDRTMICINCGQKRGTLGCFPVSQIYVYEDAPGRTINVEVNHKTFSEE